MAKTFLNRSWLIAVLVIIVLIGSIPTCSAQETSNETPCIILAKSGELYTIELTSKSTSESHNISFSFDYQEEYSNRLIIQSPYYKEDADSVNGIYSINIASAVLCSIDYEGVESVLLSDVRAKLSVTSDNYYAHLLGIQIEQASVRYDIPVSFQIVLLLCTMLPFFLLVPDAVEELQIHLDVEAGSKGVYGRILSILLPLLSIALTLLLLGGLDFLR